MPRIKVVSFNLIENVFLININEIFLLRVKKTTNSSLSISTNNWKDMMYMCEV